MGPDQTNPSISIGSVEKLWPALVPASVSAAGSLPSRPLPTERCRAVAPLLCFSQIRVSMFLMEPPAPSRACLRRARRCVPLGRSLAVALQLGFVGLCVLGGPLPGFAQFVGVTGGLRMVTSDPQSLYARKAAQSGTNSSGGTSSTSGGSSAAETELILSDGTISAQGVSGNTRTEVSHKGFTTDGSLILGPSTLETSAFALANPAADPAVEPALINYSAFTSLFLVREARSASPSFINSFSRSLR